jgi:hypothetical protein
LEGVYLGNQLTEQTPWRAEDVLILELISYGESNKRIAAHLHVSESAIKKRILRLERQLDVCGRVALVRAAFEAGVLAPRQHFGSTSARSAPDESDPNADNVERSDRMYDLGYPKSDARVHDAGRT